MRLYVEGIGLCGPGLDGWESGRGILRGETAYHPTPTLIAPSPLLPANERRRAARIVKLALAVGTEAFAASGREAAGTPSIFASSGADGETIHEILAVLASPQRELSPTRFHNSVHNAASGYWSIATAATAASTSLCCYDDSFTAGLLEAAVQATTTQRPVALIAYDVEYPPPLNAVRPIGAAFAVALVLSPTPTTAAFACIDLDLKPSFSAASPAAPALEPLRQNTPAARSLPLLEILAHRTTADIMLSYLDDMALALHIAPWSAA